MQTTLRWAPPKPRPVVPAETPSDARLLRDMGRRIAAYRKRKGWNQTELGRRVDRRQETISRWETGTVEPTLLEVVALARVLGTTIQELVTGRPC
jgi:ribosome-binding protein aMBF1 (putative translation factor)